MEGKARVVKINVDKNTQVASEYKIASIPCFIVFKKGNIVWRHAGTIDKNSLLTVLGQNA
jgi:thioredoxin 1